MMYTIKSEKQIRANTIIGIVFVMIAVLLGGCGTSRLSLQPELKSASMASPGVQITSPVAIESANELSRKLPAMTGPEHERLGDRLMARGELHSAYLHYEKAGQLGSNNIELEYKKGLALLKAGKGDEAVKQFEVVLAKAPLHAMACEGMGRAFLLKNDFAASKTHFMKAVSLDDRLWLSYNYLGALYDRESRWEEALAAYKTAVALRPQEGFIYNNLGVSFLMAEHYHSAVEALQGALKRGFANAKVYNNLGMALAHLGHTEAAFEAFKRAGGEAQAYNNLGCIYLQNRQVEKAIACFEKAIALEPVYYVKASENLKRAKKESQHL
jgi:Flp pilus assembly protein TadD